MLQVVDQQPNEMKTAVKTLNSNKQFVKKKHLSKCSIAHLINVNGIRQNQCGDTDKEATTVPAKTSYMRRTLHLDITI